MGDGARELQQQLSSQAVAWQRCRAASEALRGAAEDLAAARRRRGRGDGAVRGAPLQVLAERLERAEAELRGGDEAFQRRLAAAAAGDAPALARKLRSDYERKLDVVGALSEAAGVLKRARVVAVEHRKWQQEEEEQAANQQQQQQQQSQQSRWQPDGSGPGPSLAALVQREEAAARSTATPLPGGAASEHQLFLLRGPSVEEQDQERARQDLAELESIAGKSLLLEQMASEVGSLIAVQQDDFDRVEENSEQSMQRTIEGVHELSIARKRQAGNGATTATLGSATVGGLIGILGGPVGIAVGALAGGAVGALAGKGVAAVKRRSINLETKRVKALLAVRKQRTGELTLQAHAYEVQGWSYLSRRWVAEQRTWADEFGDAVRGAHPENELSAAEARLLMLAAARDGAAAGESPTAELDEIEAVHEREIRLGVRWEWATPRWEMVMDRAGTDLAGWDFAAEASSDTWHDEAVRGTAVRRRLWVRYLIGRSALEEGRQGASAAAGTGAGGSEMATTASTVAPAARADALLLHPRGLVARSDELWRDIYRSTVTTNSIMSESMRAVNEQGGQISKTERNATAVGDSALLAERIDRASHLSGALRNMLSSAQGLMPEAESFAREAEERRRLAASREAATEAAELAAAERRKSASAGADTIVDATARTLETNLRIARSINAELEDQNAALDRTAAAVTRGNDGVLKITQRIK
jgi:hypothetical protein